MFLSKTIRDVGMVDSVSDATGSCMENQLVENVQEQGGLFSDSVTTRSTFTAFKTSGNILMRHCHHGLNVYWNMLVQDITYVLQ